MWQTGNLILNSIVCFNGFVLESNSCEICRILRGDLCDVMTGHHGAIHARGMYVKKFYFYPTVLSECSCTLLSYIVIVFKAKCTFCSRWFFSYSSVVTRWFLVQFWNKHSMVFPCVFVGKRSKMVRLRAKVCLHFRPKNAACNTLQNNCFVFVWAISVFG